MSNWWQAITNPLAKVGKWTEKTFMPEGLKKTITNTPVLGDILSRGWLGIPAQQLTQEGQNKYSEDPGQSAMAGLALPAAIIAAMFALPALAGTAGAAGSAGAGGNVLTTGLTAAERAAMPAGSTAMNLPSTGGATAGGGSFWNSLLKNLMQSQGGGEQQQPAQQEAEFISSPAIPNYVNNKPPANTSISPLNWSAMGDVFKEPVNPATQLQQSQENWWDKLSTEILKSNTMQTSIM